MHIKPVLILFMLMTLVACSPEYQSVSRSSETLELRTDDDIAYGVADASEAAAVDYASDKTSSSIKVAPKAQIAYVYDYGYRLSADKIPALQQAHVNLCEKKGSDICRVLNMRQSGGEGDYAQGSLKIEIAAKQAKTFGSELSKAAQDSDSTQIETSISSEDLSKDIVDTQARLRARIVLRDRLMEILKNKSGKVSELVEAERGVAEVNEEIDQAQSWLAEMKGRVSFSKVNIDYSSASPSSSSFLQPIYKVLASAATILGGTIAFIIGAFIFLIPWAVIVYILLRSRRRFGWRFRFWKKEIPVTDEQS